jgi:hypothetical protein
LQADTPQLPTDPNLAQEQQAAQADLVSGLQNTTQGDMASLMARYGTQLALSGTKGMTPAASPLASFKT